MNREELLRVAKPILFNADMVQAIMRKPPNNKKCTRRAIKRFIPEDALFGYTALTPVGKISCRGTFEDGYGEAFFRLPYITGDILYVRETWNFVYDTDDSDHIIEETGRYVYYADDPMPFSYWVDPDGEYRDEMPWRPSIHMPKEAARIFLWVRGVRAIRLQDMTLDDFLAEGVVLRPEAFNDPENAWQQARKIFQEIWDETMKKTERPHYGWEANPWVWSIEFERIKG